MGGRSRGSRQERTSVINLADFKPSDVAKVAIATGKSYEDLSRDGFFESYELHANREYSEDGKAAIATGKTYEQLCSEGFFK